MTPPRCLETWGTCLMTQRQIPKNGDCILQKPKCSHNPAQVTSQIHWS